MKLFRGVALLVVPAILAACGGSDNNNREFFILPALDIEFPPPQSATNGDSVNVHALAIGLSAPVNSASVFVNSDVQASQSLAADFFRFEFPTVALADSANSVTVTATDSNTTNAESSVVIRGSSWMLERGLQRDDTGLQWLVVDAARKALLGLDLAGGKTVISGNADDGSVVGTGDAFILPEDMVVNSVDDPVGGPVERYRALVLDSHRKAIVEVDIAAGDRSICFDGEIGDTFAQPVAIEINDAQDTVYVLDAGNNSIFSIALPPLPGSGCGAVTQLPQPAGGPDLLQPIDLVLNGSRLLVSDARLEGIIAVDIATGTRSVFSAADVPADPNNQNDFIGIKNMVANGDVLYVSDTGRDAIIEVELRASDSSATPEIVSGSRTILIDTLDDGEDRVVNTANPFRFPTAMAVDVANDHLLVIDNALGVIVQVDTLDAGDDSAFKGWRNYVAGGSTPEQASLFPLSLLASTSTFEFDRPRGLASNGNGSFVYLVDSELDVLFELETSSATSQRAIVDFFSNTGIGSAGELLFTATGLINALDQTALVSATEGSYTDIAASNSGAGTGALFTVVVDDNNQITSISRTASGTDYAFGDVLTIDASDLSGAGSVTINLATDVIDFIDPQAIAAELTENGAVSRLFVVDAALDQVILIATSGDFSVLSDVDGLIAFDDPKDAVAIGDILYVLDAALDEIVAVDLTDGTRSILVNGAGASLFDEPVAMVADGLAEKLYVAEQSTAAATGEVIEVTIADGSQLSLGSYSSLGVVDMILDPGLSELADDDRLLMLDQREGEIFPFDIVNGLKGAVITGSADTANQFIVPQSMALNSRFGVLYVLDEEIKSLYAVDVFARDETDDDVDNPIVDPQRLVVVKGTALNE